MANRLGRLGRRAKNTPETEAETAETGIQAAAVRAIHGGVHKTRGTTVKLAHAWRSA